MQPTISQPQTASSRDLLLVIREGLVSQAMSVLTGSTFMIAYALKLGANSLQIGIITAIPLLSNILQLASVYFVQRYGSRKKVVVLCSGIGRMAFLLVAVLPLLELGSAGVLIIILVQLIQHGLGAVSAGAWSSWMRDVIPQSQLGSFFSRRLKLSQTVAVVLSMGCAFFMYQVTLHYQHWELYSYSLLFLGGAVCGLLSSYLLYRTSEPAMPVQAKSWLGMVKKPLRHRNFRNLMIYMASWNFAIHLSVPFASMYMLKTLGLSLPVVLGFTTLTQLTNILCYRYWGEYVDRFGNKALLSVCAPLYLVSILTWAFTTLPGRYELTIPLLVLIHVLNGIATAGTGLAGSSMGMKLAPKKDSVAYLSLLSFTNAVAAGVAPLLSGSLALWFADKSIAWQMRIQSVDVLLVHVTHWDFFFVFSFILGMFAMYRLRKVREAGTEPERRSVPVVVMSAEVQLFRRLSLSLYQAFGWLRMYPWKIKRKTI